MKVFDTPQAKIAAWAVGTVGPYAFTSTAPRRLVRFGLPVLGGILTPLAYGFYTFFNVMNSPESEGGYIIREIMYAGGIPRGANVVGLGEADRQYRQNRFALGLPVAPQLGAVDSEVHKPFDPAEVQTQMNGNHSVPSKARVTPEDEQALRRASVKGLVAGLVSAGSTFAIARMLVLRSQSKVFTMSRRLATGLAVVTFGTMATFSVTTLALQFEMQQLMTPRGSSFRQRMLKSNLSVERREQVALLERKYQHRYAHLFPDPRVLESASADKPKHSDV
eukprot:TRINITY_DN4207_c0_g1_i1.p1 TRINITY_DN4207_c0_g1~~TRINITY_DN4207_c0_g1_i1.p1  ORF type:complete len:278 (+),score=46.25 TRINITY_DN4207_c0_g1_i1:70-903(+)